MNANQTTQIQQWQQNQQNNIRVNADNSNKKVVFLFWAVFLFFLIIMFVSSNFTPTTFDIKTNRSELQDTHHKDCQNPVSFENGILVCQEFSIKSPKLGLIMTNLSPLNQFAQLNLIIIPKSSQHEIIQIKQIFQIQLMSLKRKRIVSANNKTIVGFQKGQDVKLISNLQFDSQSYKIQRVMSDQGRAQQGYQINLGFYRQFKSKDALVIASFDNIDWQLYKNYNLVLTAVLMNDNYTKFIIIMRAIFLGVMVLSSIFFLSRLNLKERIPIFSQQGIVISLSVGILLFNDPYYFIGVFMPNLFSIFIQTLFLSIFFIIILFTWIIMMQKIHSQGLGQEFKMKGCRKWVYSIIAFDYFAIIFAFNYQIGYYAYTDSPIIPAHKVFKMLSIITIILFGLLFSYIFYLYIKIFQIWRDLIWRHKIYLTFNIFFIVLLLIFLSLGWFSLYDESSQKFEILYASMNVYVLYMQYMYSIPFGKESLKLNEQFQQVDTIAIVSNSQFNNPDIIDLDQEDKKMPIELRSFE